MESPIFQDMPRLPSPLGTFVYTQVRPIIHAATFLQWYLLSTFCEIFAMYPYRTSHWAFSVLNAPNPQRLHFDDLL